MSIDRAEAHQLNADTASSLASAKSVLAIINGLTLTNTILVLITGGRYSHVTPLGKLGAENVVFSFVLIATIVRFYHGNMRHIDAAYGEESLMRAASGRHAEPRGGLGLDFVVIFLQSLLFSVASFYVAAHSTFLVLFLILFSTDVVWSVYSDSTDGGETASPQKFWYLTNLIAGIVLGFLLYRYTRHPDGAWLDAGAGVLTVATVADFWLNWRFYFPGRSKAWKPGEARRLFLSAPLTQYIEGGDPNPHEDFRHEWTCVLDELERCGHSIFSAHRREAWGAALDEPGPAVVADIAGLVDADMLIAYVGKPPSWGVQLEIGYALAARKEILVFIDRDQLGPYLVRGLGQAGAKVVEIDSLSAIRPTLTRLGYFESRANST